MGWIGWAGPCRRLDAPLQQSNAGLTVDACRSRGIAISLLITTTCSTPETRSHRGTEEKSTGLWVRAVRRQEWQRVGGSQSVKKSPVVRRVMRYVPMVEIPAVSGGGKLGDGRRGQSRRSRRRRRNLQIQMKNATELQRSRRIDQMRHEGGRFKPSDARLVSFSSELAR